MSSSHKVKSEGLAWTLCMNETIPLVFYFDMDLDGPTIFVIFLNKTYIWSGDKI